MGNSDAPEPNVHNRDTILLRAGNERQQLWRRFPFEVWVIEEPVAGDGDDVAPINRFGHDTWAEVVDEGDLCGTAMFSREGLVRKQDMYLGLR